MTAALLDKMCRYARTEFNSKMDRKCKLFENQMHAFHSTIVSLNLPFAEEDSLWALLVDNELIDHPHEDWLDADSYLEEEASTMSSDAAKRVAKLFGATEIKGSFIEDSKPELGGSWHTLARQCILSSIKATDEMTNVVKRIAKEKRKRVKEDETPKKYRKACKECGNFNSCWCNDISKTIAAQARVVVELIGNSDEVKSLIEI